MKMIRFLTFFKKKKSKKHKILFELLIILSFEHLSDTNLNRKRSKNFGANFLLPFQAIEACWNGCKRRKTISPTLNLWLVCFTAAICLIRCWDWIRFFLSNRTILSQSCKLVSKEFTLNLLAHILSIKEKLFYTPLQMIWV